MKATKATPIQAERWVLVQDGKGEFKVRIPDGGRVTFGPAIPFQKGGGRGFGGEMRMEYALRIYGPGGEKDLRAVFAGIHGFRDMDIPHARAVVKEAGKTLWKSDEAGYEVSTSVSKEKKFVALEEAKF